ncbi:MAG: TolC family protein [Desulfobacterales bacterium]|nr:TolC family protein [Desulfobacterales bacterium]
MNSIQEKGKRAGVVFLLLVLFAACNLPGVRPARAEESGPETGAAAGAERMGFDAAVQLALKQSPDLDHTGLEIDIRRLDETDSRYSFVPTVSLRVSHYLTEGTSLALVTDPYNPLEAHFSLKIRRLLTRVASLRHLQSIDAGIHDLARMFLELDNLEQQRLLLDERLALARQKQMFGQNRFSAGAVSKLELRIIARQVDLIRIERDRIALSADLLLKNLRSFLGMTETAPFKPAVSHSASQVLGDYGPDSATIEQFQAHSFELRIQELQKQLQEWNITLAYAEYVPKLSFGVRKPDILSSGTDDDFHLLVGISFPLWDGLKRRRNISRQKLISRQYGVAMARREQELTRQWQAARQELQNAAVDLKQAAAAEELARLRAEQSGLRYGAGELALPDDLDAKTAYIEARGKHLGKQLDYDLAALKIRFLCGDLFNSHVNVAGLEE